MRDLTPREIVAELDRYIVGQADAKRAVAIAIPIAGVANAWPRTCAVKSPPRTF